MVLSKQKHQWTKLNSEENIAEDYCNGKKKTEYNLNTIPVKQRMGELLKN